MVEGWYLAQLYMIYVGFGPIKHWIQAGTLLQLKSIRRFLKSILKLIKDLFSGFNIGKAILAKASIAVENYRPRFDISLPLFHRTHPEKGQKYFDLNHNTTPKLVICKFIVNYCVPFVFKEWAILSFLLKYILAFNKNAQSLLYFFYFFDFKVENLGL